jgi:hypothetical protein
MEGFNWGCVKDPGHLTQPFVLGDLHVLGKEALLPAACVPNRYPIGKGWDDHHIVNLAPAHEV